MKHFISIKDLSKEEIIEVLDTANKISKDKNVKLGEGSIIGSLFFEPSTRTRLSFTSAGYKLGAQVLEFGSPEITSLKKGESLRDTIKMIEGYADTIVMRHYIEGSAKFATEISEIPIINAGDGANEHPSQTLLDLFTIKNQFNSLENIKIAFVGDLKFGRTVHSLTTALEKFNAEFYFIAPKSIQIPDYIVKELEEKNIKYHILDKYESILNEIDVLYMTRIQRERFDNIEDYEKVKGVYKISKKEIVGKCKKSMIILHPLPRVDEINIDLDETKHAFYFQQAKNGIPTRMAIYCLALGLLESKIDRKIEESTQHSEVVCKNKRCITHFENTKNRVITKSKRKFCYYCGKEI